MTRHADDIIETHIMYALRPNYPTLHPSPLSLRPTHERVNADPDYRGRGVVIAYLDAGFYEHPDIAGRILSHVDCTTDTFKEGMTTIPAIESFVWHGMMSSVIGSGNGSLSNGLYRGIASESQLVLVKVSSLHNQLKEHDILRGFQWVLANHRRYNIRIINASIGGDFVNQSADHALHVIIRELVAQGVVVVVAAGNHGASHLFPPASAPEAITVGGLNDQNSLRPADWQLYHSNHGFAHDGTRKPDLVAPSQWVASPILPESIVAKEARWLSQLMQPHNDQTREQILQTWQADLNLSPHQVKQHDPHLYAQLEKRAHDFKLIHQHYQHVDGTSAAAPIVSSVVAQMLEAQPALTPAQVMDILKKSSRPLANVAPHKQGAGTLDAGQAISLTLAASRKTIRRVTQRPAQGDSKNAPRIS
jgi:serine protease AprX